MSEKLLSEDELRNLRVREQMILNKNLELQIIRRESRFFYNEILQKNGLDPTKVYEINGRGVIKEKENANSKGTDNVPVGEGNTQ